LQVKTCLRRPGRRSKAANMFALLQRVITRIQQYWPSRRIIVRGDAHFCSLELMDWCHRESKIGFITGLSENKRLHVLGGQIIANAQNEFEQTGRPVKRYGELSYQAGSWSRAERVIVKVEVSGLGTNIRYVVTDSRRYRARHIYEKGYCSRGKNGTVHQRPQILPALRPSLVFAIHGQPVPVVVAFGGLCAMYTLRTRVLRGTRLARPTFATIQARLLKVTGWVRELKTKISIELPYSYPYCSIFGKTLHVFGHLRS